MDGVNADVIVVGVVRGRRCGSKTRNRLVGKAQEVLRNKSATVRVYSWQI